MVRSWPWSPLASPPGTWLQRESLLRTFDASRRGLTGEAPVPACHSWSKHAIRGWLGLPFNRGVGLLSNYKGYHPKEAQHFQRSWAFWERPLQRFGAWPNPGGGECSTKWESALKPVCLFSMNAVFYVSLRKGIIHVFNSNASHMGPTGEVPDFLGERSCVYRTGFSRLAGMMAHGTHALKSPSSTSNIYGGRISYFKILSWSKTRYQQWSGNRCCTAHRTCELLQAWDAGVLGPCRAGIWPLGQIRDGTGLHVSKEPRTRPRPESPSPLGKSMKTLSLLPVGMWGPDSHSPLHTVWKAQPQKLTLKMCLTL